MKLSVEFLKKEACNFDLECVFELNLNGKGITDLGESIGLCSNLEFLNLSSNEVISLAPLKYLFKLQHLDLSCNQIKSLDGLELLENLKSLNLSGNSLFKIDEFFKLKGLKNLTQLKLTECKNDMLTVGTPATVLTNPICKHKNYSTEIFNIVTSLEVIDDHLKSRNSLLQNMLEIINRNENTSSRTIEFLTQINTEPWFSENVLATDLQEKNTKNYEALDKQRSKFNTFYDELKESFKKTNELLDIIENNQTSESSVSSI